MKYIVYLLILLVLLVLSVLYVIFRKKYELFTVYQLNYKTSLKPAWPNMTGLPIGYNRCICSSDEECRCLDDNQLDTRWEFPNLYFNLDQPHYSPQYPPQYPEYSPYPPYPIYY
jgi:hypothetical protein